jgi:class 3 adenylate cyclase
MTAEANRRLAAVWFADIVGFTTLSERDEDAALKLVAELQAVSLQVVEDHGGRVAKFVGDAVLAVFESAGKAVEAALALQDGFNGTELARKAHATLRIGVHVGEIHEAEDGDVYGDGVNTAARIQGESGPGQVFLSGFALESIRARAHLRTESVGTRSLKGLSRAMELFVVGHAEAGDPRELRFTPPAPPSEKKPLRRGQVVALGLAAGMAGLIGIGIFAGGISFDWGKAPMNENAEVALELGVESFFQGKYAEAVSDLERSLQLTGGQLERRHALRYLALTQNILGDTAAAKEALKRLLETEPPMAILHPSLEDPDLFALYMEARTEKIRAHGLEEGSQPLRKVMVFDFHVFGQDTVGVEAEGPASAGGEADAGQGAEGVTDNLGYVAAFMLETELGMKGLPVASVAEMSFDEERYDAYRDLDSTLLEAGEMGDEAPSHVIIGTVSIHPDLGALLSARLYEMATGNLILSKQITGTQEDLVMKLPEMLAQSLAEALGVAATGD